MQRKVFRIEEMMATRRRASSATSLPLTTKDRVIALAQIEQELAAMRAAIARAKAELAGMSETDSGEKPLERARSELSAAISDMEGGTDNILKATESADEAARNLVASLRNDYKRGLAQDIVDHVVKIYEYCNFQDLAGQRVNKAIDTLWMIENRLARITEIWNGAERSARQEEPQRSALLNGPKLEGDRGHATQADIDRMFG